MSARKQTRLKTGLLPALGASLLLAGCMVGPDYVRPTSTLPEQYKETTAESGAPADAKALVNPEWWTLFNDAMLNQLVQQALVANQDLQAAIARLAASEAAAREAGAELYPAVGLGAGGSRNQTSGETFNGRQSGRALYDNRRAALSLSYEVDLWGRIRRGTEAAGAEALASRYGRDSVRLALIGQLANEYLALRSHEAQLEVTRQALESRQQSLKIVQARVDGGTASGLDLAQAESALSAAQGQWSQVKRQRALSENQIGLLTGQPGLKIAAAGLEQLPVPPTPPVGLPSTLLEARPDVRQAEERLIAANARIGVARSGYFPSIALTAYAGGESVAFSRLFSGPAAIFSFAAALTQPIWNAGRVGLGVDRAEARRDQALARYRQTVAAAFKDVRDALAAQTAAREALAAETVRSAALERALHAARQRFDAGIASRLEVLDVERNLLAAELARIDAEYSRRSALADLFRALGGGWTPGLPPDPDLSIRYLGNPR